MKIIIPDIHKILFTATLPVRISDINYGNHLGHDALVTLLHEARLQFLQYYQSSEKDVSGAGIIVTGLAVKYVGEGFYADQLTIAIGVDEITRTSLSLIYNVSCDERQKQIAKAATILTFFDYTKKQVVSVPEEFY